MSNVPELTVVVPTRNRAERLQRCLEALGRQTAPTSDYEVVVVDDGSTDDTQRVLEEVVVPYSLRVSRTSGAGSGAARNAGASAALGRWLLFLDDDVVASPGTVAAHLAIQRARSGVVGIGLVERQLSATAAPIARSAVKQFRAHYERLARSEQEPTFRDCYSGNLSIPTESFAAVGGYAEDLPVEVDVELGFRLSQRGLAFAFVPRADVREDHREDVSEVVADAVMRGRVAVELYRRHPAMLPALELGGYGQPGGARSLLRQALLAARVSPSVLALALRPVRRRADAAHRFLFDFGYWYGVRAAIDPETWRRLRRGTLILLYHAVGGPADEASRFLIPLERFRRQMRWLHRRGYRVVSMSDYLRSRADSQLLPPKTVVITFDDGYADNELTAPVLTAFGFTATIFHVTSGVNGWQSGALAERPLLSRERVRALATEATFSFGGHTRSHPSLVTVSSERLEDEVAGCKVDLGRLLNQEIDVFAYPFGEHDDRVRDAVGRAGFAAACTVEDGRNRPATDPYRLRRVEVFGTDSILVFTLLVAFGEIGIVRRARRRHEKA